MPTRMRTLANAALPAERRLTGRSEVVLAMQGRPIDELWDAAVERALFDTRSSSLGVNLR